MTLYVMRLSFGAKTDTQAQRLAETWADTCAAEFGTKFLGVEPLAATAPIPVVEQLP